MINRVILVGRTTKEIDLRATSSNVYVTQFTMAVNRPFTSQNGEKQADFINVLHGEIKLNSWRIMSKKAL